MNGLRDSSQYADALIVFNQTNCKHSKFKEVHIEKTKNRCPICECLLDGSVQRDSNSENMTALHGTIDHYRPIDIYSNFRCEHSNYLLMCSDCNGVLKDNSFPLFGNQTRVSNISEVAREQPLIVNPIDDNIFELFTLHFILSTNNKNIVELAINSKLLPDSYLYEKAKTTIAIFKLGYCNNFDNNNNIESCRIDIFETHFNVLYEFANARKKRKKNFKQLLERSLNIYGSNGFVKFIFNDNFKDLIPQGNKWEN